MDRFALRRLLGNQPVAATIAAEKVDYNRRKPAKLTRGSMAHRLATYLVSNYGNGLTVQDAAAYLATYKMYSNDVAGRLRDAVYYLRHKGLTVKELEYTSENGKKCTRWEPEYDWALFHQIREELA